MKEENDIYDLLIDKQIKEFEDNGINGKYIINDTETKPFYTWSRLNDDQIDNHFRWLDYLKPGDPIIYKSSSKISGYKKTDSWSKNNVLGEGSIVDTGYIIPEFKFISFYVDRNFITEEDYKSVLTKFGITKDNDNKISPETALKIFAFKDAILQQLTRQADFVLEINKEIIDVLKVYFYETELAITELDASTKKRLEIIDLAERSFKVMTRMLLMGAQLKYLEEHKSVFEGWKKYPPEIYWESTINGLTK